MSKAHNAAGADLKPPPDDQRRHSYSGDGNEKVDKIAGSSSNPGLGDKDKDKGREKEKEKKRGLFSKLKDKAIGTKEEREAEKRHEAEVVHNTLSFIFTTELISTAC